MFLSNKRPIKAPSDQIVMDEWRVPTFGGLSRTLKNQTENARSHSFIPFRLVPKPVTYKATLTWFHFRSPAQSVPSPAECLNNLHTRDQNHFFVSLPFEMTNIKTTSYVPIPPPSDIYNTIGLSYYVHAIRTYISTYCRKNMAHLSHQ